MLMMLRTRILLKRHACFKSADARYCMRLISTGGLDFNAVCPVFYEDEMKNGLPRTTEFNHNHVVVYRIND